MAITTVELPTLKHLRKVCPGGVLALDLETGGLDPRRNPILALAAYYCLLCRRCSRGLSL
jgi:hypothetical protein